MGKQTSPHQHDHTALRLSLFLSTLCLIHCITFPILAAVLPLLNIMFAIPHWLEWVLLGGTFPIGMYSLWHGYSLHHKKVAPMIVFNVGMALAIGVHALGSHDTDIILTVIAVCGALMIAYAQFWNLKLTRTQPCTTKH